MLVTLAELRARHKLSQEALAQHLGLSQAAVSAWERGVWMPSLKTARKVAAFFGVPLDDIEFSGASESTPGARAGEPAERDTTARKEAAS